jgi:hypothetical protein
MEEIPTRPWHQSGQASKYFGVIIGNDPDLALKTIVEREARVYKQTKTAQCSKPKDIRHIYVKWYLKSGRLAHSSSGPIQHGHHKLLELQGTPNPDRPLCKNLCLCRRHGSAFRVSSRHQYLQSPTQTILPGHRGYHQLQ